MKSLFLFFIRLYQRLKSLFLVYPAELQRRGACRFTPTCSQYSYQAIDKYGILKGGLLSLKRIFKCHPWSKGGPDKLK